MRQGPKGSRANAERYLKMAPAQRAPDFYCATSDAHHRGLRSGRIGLLTDILSSSPKDVILAPTDFRRGILLCPEIVLSADAMLPWWDWVVHLPAEWTVETKVKMAHTLHCPVSTPARCREHGTVGGQGKAVGCVPPTALLSLGRSLNTRSASGEARG